MSVSVKAVLMTYDYDKKRNAYHRDSCKAVADFSALILNNLEKLQTSGIRSGRRWTDRAAAGWMVGVLRQGWHGGGLQAHLHGCRRTRRRGEWRKRRISQAAEAAPEAINSGSFGRGEVA